MKKLFAIILPLTILFLVSGCAKDEPKGMSDAELVQAIIDAEDKTEVSMEELPSVARGTMEEDYLNEYLHLYSMKASMLGYEVSIAGRAGNSGKRGEVYFDIDGKKLDPGNYRGKEDGEWSEANDRGTNTDWRCFDIVYPITIQMPDGSTLSIDGEEDTDLEIVKNYYEENDTEEKPSMVFPITIITYEGVTKTISSEEEMSDAYRGCSGRDRERDWDRERDCFELVYPVTYVLPDGSTIEISDEEDEAGWESLKSWYEANPESEERPSLQYPVDIVYESEESEDGETVTINSEDEMMVAKEECREMWGEEDWDKDDCFELVYPVTYVLPDGSTIEISDEEDEAGWESLKSWYEANPESEERPSLQYPVDIVYESEESEDGETVTINSEDEMMVAKEECREMWGEEGWEEEEECYAFVYPISFLMPDGSTIEISSEGDEAGWMSIREYYEANPSSEEEPSMQFPVDIVFETEEGEATITVGSGEDLDTFEDERCGRPS